MGSSCADLSKSIQDFIIKQCTQKLNFTESLEVDGVMCVSLDKNAPDIVIQIHRCIVPSTAWKNLSLPGTGSGPSNTLFNDSGQAPQSNLMSKPTGSRKKKKGKKKSAVVNEPVVTSGSSRSSHNQNSISPGNYFVLDQPYSNLPSNIPQPPQEGFVNLGPPFVLDANHPMSSTQLTTFSTPLAGVEDQLHWNSIPVPTPMALYDVTRQMTIDIGDMNQSTTQQPLTSAITAGEPPVPTLAAGTNMEEGVPKNSPLVKSPVGKKTSKGSARRSAAPVCTPPPVEVKFTKSQQSGLVEEKRSQRRFPMSPEQVLTSKRVPKVRIEMSSEMREFQQKVSMECKSHPKRTGKPEKLLSEKTLAKQVSSITPSGKTRDEVTPIKKASKKILRGGATQKKGKVTVGDIAQDSTPPPTRRSKRSLPGEEPDPEPPAGLYDSDSSGSRKRPRKMVKPKRHPEYKKDEETAETPEPVKGTPEEKTPRRQKSTKSKSILDGIELATKTAKSPGPSASFKKSLMKRYAQKAPSPEKSSKFTPKDTTLISKRSKAGPASTKKQSVKKTIVKKIGPKSKAKPTTKSFKSPLITNDLMIVLSQVNVDAEVLKLTKQDVTSVNLEENSTHDTFEKVVINNDTEKEKDEDLTPSKDTDSEMPNPSEEDNNVADGDKCHVKDDKVLAESDIVEADNVQENNGITPDDAAVQDDERNKGYDGDIDEHKDEQDKVLTESVEDVQDNEPVDPENNINPIDKDSVEAGRDAESAVSHNDIGEGSNRKDVDILSEAVVASGLEEMASAMNQLDSGTLSTPAVPTPPVVEEEISL